VAPGTVKAMTPMVVNATKAAKNVGEAVRRPISNAVAAVRDAVTPLGRAQTSAGKWLNSLPKAELTAAQKAALTDAEAKKLWQVGQHHTSYAPSQAELAANSARNQTWQRWFKERANQNLSDGLAKNKPELAGLKNQLGNEASTARMAAKRNPRDGDGLTWEWSHEPIPDRLGGSTLVPRRPLDHALVDPYRWQTTGSAGTNGWGANGRFAPLPDSFWSEAATPQPAGVP
jgi:hypothetical protein